jgi:hypothetical protein
MPGVGHIGADDDAGPAVTAWLASRFGGQAVSGPCGPSAPGEQ